MARNNNLAGLAALGALGYMLTKDKGQAADQTPGPGRQSQGAGYDSFGTNTGSATDLKTPMQSIAEADKSDRSSSLSMKGDSGVTTAGPAYNEPTTTAKSTAASPKAATPKSKGISYPSGVMAGAAKTSPDMYPSGVMGGKRQADSAASTQPTARRETYKGLDGKIHYKENVAKPSTSTMRNPRTGREMTTFKKGGAVKMASGGMTASRRADGIATKGKTRGKIC
jgi:hypothetical protein